MFFAMYKESGNSSKSAPPISVKTSFKNLINDSVAVPGKLNLVRKFIIHSNIHKNWLSFISSGNPVSDSSISDLSISDSSICDSSVRCDSADVSPKDGKGRDPAPKDDSSKSLSEY